MLLTKVRIENFKRFEQLDVELKPLDCLVGPNNSGKTTLLQAMALFDFCVHHCLSKKNGGYELRGRTISPADFYVLPVSDPLDLWTDRKSTQAKPIRICATFDEQQCVTATVKLNFNRFGIAIEPADLSQEWLAKLAMYRIAYLPVFSTFLAQEERRTSAVVNDELARGHVHSVIRNLLLDLKEKNLHGELVTTLRRSFPSLEHMRIDFDEVSDRYISVVYQEAARPREFDVFSAGSGFQQFLYLFGFIRLQQPTMILLDEPDVHLHASLQKALLLELSGLVEKEGKQVLFATHSRDLIDGVTPETVISLENNGAKRLAIAYDVYDTLDRLGAVAPTQLPIIQAYQRILIVEDETDSALLAMFCSKCLGQSIWQQVERRLAICYAKGNPSKQPIAKLRQQLQQMISLGGRTLQAFAVADWDYYPDRPQLEDHIATDHVVWHIWERAEIENYLLCPEAVIRLLGGRGRYPLLEDQAFRQEYGRLLDSSYDSANDHLVEAFGDYRRLAEEKWDNVTISRKAREYLKSRWDADKVALADAKDIVLPGIKRWLQEHAFGQFSNRSLAEALLPQDLPEEVHKLARELTSFAGITVNT
jgi:predicted ATPase